MTTVVAKAWRAILLTPLALAMPALLFTSLAANAQTPAPGPLLEEIIVTAQKREQPLQEVSLSMDVLRGGELDMLRSSARDILFLAARSPSLYAESSSGRTFPRFYIRGLGNTDFDLNASQPVSLVYDEVVLENSILKGFPVFDMDRIEILRGPQGTLFGRNTPAGVIKFESVKPSQTPSGYLRGSFGRFDTIDVEGAYGGPLVDNVLSARASLLYQKRDDFVDNTFSGGEDGFEEFEEFAGRFQLLYQPGERVSALLNIHGRSLSGGSRLFRANIIEVGTDRLVDDFDLFETGQDATQILDVDNIGASLKIDWDLSAGALTSVTAYEHVEITARGDVDGGFGADFAPPVGRGSIPFPAESADNITGHDQLTEELRFVFNPLGTVSTTFGTFLFYENLEIENLSFDTLANGVVNGLAVQDQETFSWALFAASEWALNDRLTLNGGIRLSSENRDFVASRILGPFGAPPLGPITRNLDDTVVSGDVSGRYAFSDDFSVYARYARSFRAPSVQGRIVFGDAVTVADTETIDSFEAGFKSALWGGRGRFNASAYYFQTDDQQLTAVGGAGNFNQLLNADTVRGYGLELDATVKPLERLEITAGYSYNHTEIDDPNLEVAVCAVACTVLDPINPLTGNARIDGNPLPQAPKHIANMNFRYGIPLQDGAGELYLAGDVAYRSWVNFFLYRSVEFSSKDLTEVGFRAGYVGANGKYEMAVFGRNVLDQRSINGGIDFNNFSGFVSDPAVWGVELITSF